MKQGTRMTAGLMLAAMTVACGPSQPPSEPEVAQQPAEYTSVPPPAAEPSEPMSAVPTPTVSASSAPTGSMVVYLCDDRSGVTVTYDENSALVKLPIGSTMLSRAEPVSNGGEAYLGEELSLYRNGNTVQLLVAGKSRICTKSSG